jgi:hypothetical protein
LPTLLSFVIVLVACGTANGPTGLDLRRIDWRNVSVPGTTCLTSGEIQLRNGSALIPDDNRGHPTQPGAGGQRYDSLEEILPVTFGDVEGGQVDAAVPLYCNNNGGTADGALLYSLAVYSGRKGTVHFLGLITPRHQPADVLPTLLSDVRMSSGMITVSELWYGPRDGTCCPSGKSTTIWKYSAGHLQPASTS